MRVAGQQGLLAFAVCMCLATESASFLAASTSLPVGASGAFLSSQTLPWSSLAGGPAGKGTMRLQSTLNMVAKPGTKVLVVGAGPAGLLSAHYLLKRGYDVTVAEKRDDPRNVRLTTHRRHDVLRYDPPCIVPRMPPFDASLFLSNDRQGANPSLRSYSLGLGVRGRGAIK